MRLTDLLADALPSSTVIGRRDREISGIAYDSRSAAPGSLFAALRGFVHDGHRFVSEAVRRGAVAVLVDHPLPDIDAVQIVVPDTRPALGALAAAFYRHPSRELWLCGVTGTNGKTTTTYLIDAVLRGAGRPSAVVGTTGVLFGGASVDFHTTTSTTPEAPDLQELLRRLRNAGAGDVVMEVTSHALQLSRVAGCAFDAAVFTNLTQDHLDLHGDLVAYRNTKARLFAMVEPDGVSVVNADDPAGEVMAAHSRARVLTYGVDRSADVRADEIEFGGKGTALTIQWPGGRGRVVLRLPGRFNVSNALAAFTVALAGGIDPDQIMPALAQVEGVPGRCEVVDEGQPFTVLVDYAHSPDSLEKILRLARQITGARTIAIFGCGGDRDRLKRPLMGRIATQLADCAIFTSDNPRSEDPLSIVREIEAGVSGAANFESVVDRRAAIARGLAMARPGDVVVIAGKGHETYQVLRDRTEAFDDRQVARELLRARPERERAGAR